MLKLKSSPMAFVFIIFQAKLIKPDESRNGICQPANCQRRLLNDIEFNDTMILVSYTDIYGCRFSI